MDFVKIVYGCNKLEDENFKGTYRCNYATSEQITLDQLKEELQKK